MERKMPSRATVEKWIHDYPELEFNGVDLWCKVCQCKLTYNIKTRVTNHLATEKHKAHVQGNRSVKEHQKQFNVDLVKMMVSCKMPWTTLSNPAFRQFLQSCIDGKYGRVSVPGEGTVRKNYLSPACDEIQQGVFSELSGKNIWLSVNESVGEGNRNTVHILVGGLDETSAMPARLIASKVLPEITPETISHYVDSSLEKIWDNDLNNRLRVLLYLTNSSASLKASAELLKGTYKYENLLHVICLAHGLYSVAETIKNCYPTIDELIDNMKKFLKEQSRKQLFQEELPNIPLPPELEETQWSTWLEAASYYYVHFDTLKTVIDKVNMDNTLGILHIQQVFCNLSIRNDLQYIHSHFSRIYLSIKNLDASPTVPGYSIVSAVNIVFDLRHFICSLLGSVAERVRDKFDEILKSNPGFPTLCAIVNLLTGKEVDFSESNVNVPSLKNFACFRYAPVALVGFDRQFSSYKNSFSDKRLNLTPEHLEQLLLIFFNSSSD